MKAVHGVAAGLGLLLLLVGSCARDRTEEPPGAEERVADLPGVVEVEVSEGEIDQDGPQATTFFVTLDDDPSAEEVAAVLTELTEPGVDGNVRTMTHVGEASGYGGGVLAGDVAVRDVTDPADVQDAAELFTASLAVVEELGGEAGADVDYDSELTPTGSGAVVGINPASPSQADVDAAVAAVADDPVLSDAGALVVGQDVP